MLQKTEILKKYKLCASDGDLGYLKEFHFDSSYWNMRYLGVDTGGWLNERRILLPPNAMNIVYGSHTILSANVTREQVEKSPTLSCGAPISRKFEKVFYTYYQLPEHHYGFDPETGISTNLGTTADVSGHHIQALDGEIGHVVDFIINMKTWDIPYLLVDTKNWWAGKQVMISTRWIESILPDESKIIINQPMEKIRQSAEYNTEFLNQYDQGVNDGQTSTVWR
jgi:hypothetical protein